MSHAIGLCKFASDGLVLFFDYNGTTDVCVSHLAPSFKEVWDNVRNFDWLYCVDGKDEPVTLFTDYGNGFFWKGRACRRCRAITEGNSPFDSMGEDAGLGFEHGVPDWATKAIEESLQQEHD